jgi:hypothetical protein
MPLQARKGRFCETNPILPTAAWASLVVIQIVRELSANASNTLQRREIGAYLKSIFEASLARSMPKASRESAATSQSPPVSHLREHDCKHPKFAQPTHSLALMPPLEIGHLAYRDPLALAP